MPAYDNDGGAGGSGVRVHMCSCVCVYAVVYLTQFYWLTIRYFCLPFHFYEQLADREVRHGPGALRKWC